MIYATLNSFGKISKRMKIEGIFENSYNPWKHYVQGYIWASLLFIVLITYWIRWAMRYFIQVFLVFPFCILSSSTCIFGKDNSKNYPFTQALFSNWNRKTCTILMFAKRIEFQKGILIFDYIHILYLSCVHC